MHRAGWSREHRRVLGVVELIYDFLVFAGHERCSSERCSLRSHAVTDRRASTTKARWGWLLPGQRGL
jgi:hypothetical protein